MVSVLLTVMGLAHADGDVATGRKLYQANCVACHGAKADGKGPAAGALRPPPTDFTAAAYWASVSEAQVKAAIKGGSPGTAMMGFTRFSDAELDALAAFLRSNAPAE